MWEKQETIRYTFYCDRVFTEKNAEAKDWEGMLPENYNRVFVRVLGFFLQFFYNMVILFL